MQLSQVIPLLLFLAIGSSQALSEEEKKTLLQLHNDYRSKVTPPAADMLKMYWDTDLEKLAKSYAAECKWDHNPKRGSTGENLYLTSSKTVSMQGAMNMWHGEQKDYNFSTMACTENKMCGHYTQVVWAASSKVGCGEHFCEQVEKEKPNQSIMVCNYKPPGNVNGQRPYTEGKPCSKCPAEYKCVDNLCAIEQTAPDPSTTAIEETAPDSSVGWNAVPHSTTIAISKTDSSAGRNFPTSIYFCLLSAIFGLKLFF
ncbi:peptidase inhibitor 16 isoform X2 [Microcaecilia unicolor]|uniref:Peptidase inhibitor 16 n=1 Tax=Microcaecilia unicolor TaxID=1415580 RepID=A0A6P7ZS87_9AMPH|nr:peptidase inhibitor 16 isoform X2 [Microcaecilia unicolor]